MIRVYIELLTRLEWKHLDGIIDLIEIHFLDDNVYDIL